LASYDGVTFESLPLSVTAYQKGRPLTNNSDEAIEVAIELLTKLETTLLEIRNLLEDQTANEKLCEEMHRLSSVIGKLKSGTPESSQASSKKKSLPLAEWFKDDKSGTFLCSKPVDAPEGECKKCGKKIYWTLSKAGKRIPIGDAPDFPSKFVSHFENYCGKDEEDEGKEQTHTTHVPDTNLPF
tara:strand:- start:517 stop:1068 length:552 start_codon:yes stop_codon:yes gene_type:complete